MARVRDGGFRELNEDEVWTIHIALRPGPPDEEEPSERRSSGPLLDGADTSEDDRA